MPLETPPGDTRKTALAIGQEIEVRVQDLLEEFGTVATAIKDDRDAALVQQSAHLCQDRRQHLDHPSIGLGGEHEQWVSALVVDPVVGSGRQGEAHPGHMRFGQTMLSVINAHVAVDVKEAQLLSTDRKSTRLNS